MTQDQRQYRRGRFTESGPCSVCGAMARLERDHCHEHGYLRGVVCRRCNLRMKPVDQGNMAGTVREEVDRQALVVHWHNCPKCALEPWKAKPNAFYRFCRRTYAEHVDRPVSSSTVRLWEVGWLRAEVEWTVHQAQYGQCFASLDECVCSDPMLRFRNRRLVVLNGCETVRPLGEPGAPFVARWPTRSDVAQLIRSHRTTVRQ